MAASVLAMVMVCDGGVPPWLVSKTTVGAGDEGLIADVDDYRNRRQSGRCREHLLAPEKVTAMAPLFGRFAGFLSTVVACPRVDAFGWSHGQPFVGIGGRGLDAANRACLGLLLPRLDGFAIAFSIATWRKGEAGLPRANSSKKDA